MDDKTLRRNLLELINGGIAYVPIEEALERVKPKNRNVRPSAAAHSIWEELEHMRITQEDILRYTLDPAWKSPTWPAGYWPAANIKLTPKMWASTLRRFFADMHGLKSMVNDPRLDLTTKIPHGEGRTYLRQILLATEHNTYHTGQIMLLRKLHGDWPTQ